MKTLTAFVKKDFKEQFRSGKLAFILIIFTAVGIMNPAVAKLTPWLLEIFADSLTESGMTITDVTVTAMDSWVQFFKNMPIALIVFVLLEGSILTSEYSSGTLVLSLTKGLERFKVVISKTAILTLLWSVCYWLCFGITYFYSGYFWDNSIAKNLLFSALCYWIFGIFTVALIILFSVISNSNTGVLLGGGAVVLASVMLGMIPKLEKVLPTKLTDGNSLIYGMQDTKEYLAALIVTLSLSTICFAVSIPIFNKKEI